MTNKKRPIKRPIKKKNNKIDFFSKQVVGFLIKNSNKSYNFKQIASALDLDSNNQKEYIIKALHKLKTEDKIEEKDRGKYSAKSLGEEMEGVIDVTKSGNAYVVVEDLEQDILVLKKDTYGAFHKDTVTVLVYGNPKKDSKLKGKITGILKRKKDTFVGNLSFDESKNFGFIVIDNHQIHSDIYVKKSNFKGALNGEKVIVEVTEWPTNGKSPIGEITEVLGNPEDHNVKIHAILAEYDLPNEFPPEVEQEAKDLATAISPEEIAKRRDMRDVTTFTIDPADAKDFDDALSVQKLPNGNWEIGIHIADVSHYVRPGTLLDTEAVERATSVYLVDRVVPMLPEVLSNFACSLRPNEEKYTFSAVFEISEEAEIVKQWFGRTVIYSDKRFAYQDAQDIIESGEGELKEEVLILDKIAKQFREKRIAEGALTFDRIEVKFQVSEEGEPVGIFFKQSKEANHLVEEFMLLANKKVSEFVSVKQGKETKNTFIYRTHDNPNPEKLQNLKEFIQQFGYDIDLQNPKKIAQSLNELLKAVKGNPEENMIETLTLRCMSKAEYTTENIGHYGLGFAYYSHFTSPIRRYPDIIAHRLLQNYIEGGKSPNRQEYEDLCKHCSAREKLASDAERDSIKYMQVKYMENKVGEEFEGLVTGVTEWGMYIELPASRSEGLIRLKSLRDDHYRYDSKNHCILGQTNGKKYSLGDTLTIKVTKADIDRKQLDFELVTD